MTNKVFSSEHAFPSKFWIYLEHCPRGEAVITGHLRLSSIWGSQLRKNCIPAIIIIIIIIIRIIIIIIRIIIISIIIIIIIIIMWLRPSCDQCSHSLME